ncbi:MAG TPA: hypothetical protein VNZ26_19385 [Vicinamibacterales bacterium]|jgi:hypothetical protein|nr:hypothetical protein [Vicinamibacterales bacterium]
MTIKNVMASVLVVSMVTMSLPAFAAEAGIEAGIEPTVATEPATRNVVPLVGGAVRVSVAHAVESAAIAETKTGSIQTRTRSLLTPEFTYGSGSGSGSGNGNGMGGGMSTVSTVMMIVGTVVGIGATVYMVKQLKKTTASVPTTPAQ